MWSNRDPCSVLTASQDGKPIQNLTVLASIKLHSSYLKELKAYLHTSCTQMFIAELIHNCQNLEASKMHFST